jgi:hypothetical protein
MPSTRHDTLRSEQYTFTCECGAQFDGTVFHRVNVTLEPHLLYTLLAGRLNVATCPHCGRAHASPLPFLYHDLKRGLLAYVHPGAEPEDDERDQLLEDLGRVYSQAVEDSERLSPPRARRWTPSQPRPSSSGPVAEPEAPPMQVIFGLDRLVHLVESLLEPGERLGQVSLTTRSQDPAERDRLLAVGRQMAAQLPLCQAGASEAGGVYTVKLYGPRTQVGQLVNLLAHTP